MNLLRWNVVSEHNEESESKCGVCEVEVSRLAKVNRIFYFAVPSSQHILSLSFTTYVMLTLPNSVSSVKLHTFFHVARCHIVLFVTFSMLSNLKLYLFIKI